MAEGCLWVYYSRKEQKPWAVFYPHAISKITEVDSYRLVSIGSDDWKVEPSMVDLVDIVARAKDGEQLSIYAASGK
jgi:hypothetical protein